MPLYLTSFLFAVSSYHAARIRNHFHHIGWLLQYGLSVLHHANYTNERAYWGGRTVGFFDRLMAHALFGDILWNCIRMQPTPAVAGVWVHLGYIVGIYYGNIRHQKGPYPKDTWIVPHTTMHIATFVGAQLFLWEWNRQQRANL